MPKYTLYVSRSVSLLGSTGVSKVMHTLSLVKGFIVGFTSSGTAAGGGDEKDRGHLHSTE